MITWSSALSANRYATCDICGVRIIRQRHLERKVVLAQQSHKRGLGCQSSLTRQLCQEWPCHWLSFDNAWWSFCLRPMLMCSFGVVLRSIWLLQLPLSSEFGRVWVQIYAARRSAQRGAWRWCCADMVNAVESIGGSYIAKWGIVWRMGRRRVRRLPTVLKGSECPCIL